MQVQVVVTLPAIPVRVAAARMKWATDRIGRVAWVIVAVLIGGIYWHLGQPPERREKIRDVAGPGRHTLAERRPGISPRLGG
jgi:hypothetical protein